MSGNSWANMGQECIKCHINVYPHKQVSWQGGRAGGGAVWRWLPEGTGRATLSFLISPPSYDKEETRSLHISSFFSCLI